MENMSDAIAFGGVIYLVSATLLILAMIAQVRRCSVAPKEPQIESAK
jgi:hypothetical protein